MQTGQTVAKWRERMETRVTNSKTPFRRPNDKYSGNVYDAVWLYALALDELVKQNKSYIQDFRTERSIEKFVEIINEIDFFGVTGRINFVAGHSRLSNIKIMQWYDNATHEIGVYEPNYANASVTGRMLYGFGDNLIWQTVDGAKPSDRSAECGVLSKFADALDLDCEKAIVLAFVIGFGVLFSLLVVAFFVYKRRYEKRMKQTEDRMRALGLLTPTSLLTLDEWEIPRDRVVINRKLGEGAFGTVYGGEAFFDEKGWVS